MSEHIIRFATLSDVDAIMNFINNHWQKDHILAKNKDFFLYEYVDAERVNFVVATDKIRNEIVGVCGFIKNTKELAESDIWGALWKVIKTSNPMLGINILEYLNEKSGCRSFSSCGIAKKTIPIYDFLKYKTGKLKHYYRLDDRDNYKIAVVKDKVILKFDDIENYKLVLLEDFQTVKRILDKIQKSKKRSHKDNWYIEKRYFKHPIYKYHIFGIKKAEIDSIIVAREIQQNKATVLRIVDLIGNQEDIRFIGKGLQDLISQNKYEYVDFYCEGISHEILESAGLKFKSDSDLNKIPNYFEPFVQENVEIYYFTTHNEIFPIFKADGDQDRPSI